MLAVYLRGRRQPAIHIAVVPSSVLGDLAADCMPWKKLAWWKGIAQLRGHFCQLGRRLNGPEISSVASGCLQFHPRTQAHGQLSRQVPLLMDPGE